MPLEQYRTEIDHIDNTIKELFLRRMEIVTKVAAYKIDHALEVLQPQRETALLEKLTKGLSTTESEEITALYQTILSLSRDRQQEIIEEKRDH